MDNKNTENTENARTAALGSEPYWDSSLSVEDRVNDLIQRMSLQEKIGQMMQFDARSDLDSVVLANHAGSILHTSPEELPRAHYLVQQTRLRIPLLVGDDLIHGYSFYPGATIFPEQLSMACSWDPEKIKAAARVTAREAVTTGVQWTFSPVLCIARDTRWGRVGETFGEDPYLIGEMAAAMVKGYQGDSALEGQLPRDAILATAKHFAGYSETQGGRDASEADLSHRKLASWFLPPFERVAREGVATFMLGYESIDGIPVTLNRWLLHDVLRGQWGYKGTLITDWANVSRLVWEQHVQPDPVSAAVAAVRAGNDLIMTSPEFYQAAYQAVHQGLLAESELDQPVKRILALKFRLGLFEDSRLPDPEAAKRLIGCPEHGQVNLDLTRESVVLLRNNGLLPLLHNSPAADADSASASAEAGPASANAGLAPTDAESAGGPAPRRIALIGPLIDDAQTQLGDWAGSSGQVTWMPEGHPRETITTIQDGLQKLVPQGWTVTSSRGADILHLMPDPEGEFYPDGQPRPLVGVPAQTDSAKLEEALKNARESDCIVAVVGDLIQLMGEGCSTATLELQGAQNHLLDALKETGKPLVVVLMSSKPQVLPASALTADALLWAPSPGMKGGQAIAEILLGLTNPSGRLPITFPRHAGQLPVYYNQIRGQHGTRYADLTEDPAFAFGEGLGYTTFVYGDVKLSGSSEEAKSVETENADSAWAPVSDRTSSGDKSNRLPLYHRGDSIEASIDLTNTGHRPGTEIVQLYIGDLFTSVSWTDRELKAFRRVILQPGEKQTVTFTIPVNQCTIVNADAQRIVEDGTFEVLIGHSSRRKDLKAARFIVS